MDIVTKQIRWHREPRLGLYFAVEHRVIERPSSLDTWIENVGIIAAEEGLMPLDIHQTLFNVLPEIFGA